jgi:hypothetical protein
MVEWNGADELPRTVVVDRLHDAGNVPECRLDGSELAAEHCSHGALPDRHRLLHVLAAHAHQAHRALEGQRTCCDVGGVLTQAVPRDHIGRLAERAQERDGDREDGRLRVGGEAQLLVGPLEAQP